MRLWLMLNMIDWRQDQFPEYVVHNTAWHLERSSPSADLKDYLRKLSFEHFIENIRTSIWPAIHTPRLRVVKHGIILLSFPGLLDQIYQFVASTQALVRPVTTPL